MKIMNKKDLIFELNSWQTAERIHRDKSAKFVSDHLETVTYLVEIVFEYQKRMNIKAAWILEIVCFKNVCSIAPFLDHFTQNLAKIKDESALRPIAKVCSFIARSYYSTPKNEINNKLTKNNIELIVESNFDWLIEDHKVACKVYAMDTLLLFGREFDWVHDELKLTLEKNMMSGSAGYKSHTRKILKELNS